MSLVAEIRAEMGRKGMRPSDLARTTGMSKQKISRMISKEAQAVQVEDLEKIAKSLGLPPWELMRRSEENEEGATCARSDAPGNNKKAGHFND